MEASPLPNPHLENPTPNGQPALAAERTNLQHNRGHVPCTYVHRDRDSDHGT